MLKIYPHIGTVEIVANKRLTRISLKVGKSGVPQLSMPHLRYLPDAEAFLLQKSAWIESAKRKIAQRTPKQTLFSAGDTLTPQHSLRFVQVEYTQRVRAKISETEVIVFHAPQVESGDYRVQECVAKAREQALVNMAQMHIPSRLQKLAQDYHFTYAQCKISRAKGRWGSCSHANSISISCYIMLLPPHLIDFILLHELTHSIHKNHGAAFHAYLQRLLPKPEKDYEQEIRKYSIR
ncbi:MAG: M48 family metallopeptidase [Bacteroidales bacterium]|jgi:predicted metal-dependent hydrolase|nr:M48 family metallopeptidase [Bacteroidales bacterium]